MLRHEKGQAAESVIVPKGDSRGNDGAPVDGLNVKNSRASAGIGALCNGPSACYAVRIRSQEWMQAWKPAS